MKSWLAEFIGTLWLVLCGCGSAVLAYALPGTGPGWVGIALAFGLAVMTMGWALASIAPCHFNPAVTLGAWAAGQLPRREVLPMMAAQLLGGIIGATLLYAIASGQPGFEAWGGFSANGYGPLSPGGFSVGAAFLAETSMTLVLTFVVLSVSDKQRASGLAPLSVGLCVTLIHLVTLPITNTSVNPARSTAAALFAGDPAIGQLWLFWVAPMLGGLMGAAVYMALSNATAASRVSHRSIDIPIQ